MANPNLNQYVANKQKIDIVSKSHPLEQAIRIHRFGSLVSINPSRRRENLSAV